MESKFGTQWRMTLNEKKFIENALLSDLRVDGRRPFDYRRLTIEFGREDGSSEVQLGQTRVMSFVTGQLVQPFRDRPNEGTLSIFTEFSPMADPNFEAGRPGESAVELGRIVDRGLRESRAIDTESLCVLAGKLVWSIRIDLHILDNGGNLVDAANIAALAALLTFRRPECTLGGEEGPEVIVHPPEVREPLPLIVHHLPIAVTFAFFGESIVVVDPTHMEEAVMGGRMTATINTNGDICAIQKPGGMGILQSVVMQCLRIASVKAADMTSKIKAAVDSYNTKRAFNKVKRHPPSHSLEAGIHDFKSESKDQISSQKTADMDVDTTSSQQTRANGRDHNAESSTSGPSSRDSHPKDIDSELLKCSLASHGTLGSIEEQNDSKSDLHPSAANAEDPSSPLAEVSLNEDGVKKIKSLEDAVKRKSKRKKKTSSATNTG